MASVAAPASSGQAIDWAAPAASNSGSWAAASSTAAPGGGEGWLGGGGENNWGDKGGETPDSGAGAAWGKSAEGAWGGSPNSWDSGSPAAQQSGGPSWGGAPKVRTPENAGGWLGGEESPDFGDGSWGGGQSNNSAPSAEGPNWGGAPSVQTPQGGGWLGAEGDAGWSDSDASTPLSSMVDHAISETEDSFEDESWVDDEAVVEDVEAYDLDSLDVDSRNNGAVKGLVAALIVLLLGSGFFLLRPTAAPPEPSAEEIAADSLSVGRTMIKDAELSNESGMPEVAANQALAAISQLKDGNAPAEEIHAAREAAAGYFIDASEYEQAVEQYEILAGVDEEKYGPALDKAQASFDKNERILAQGALEDASKALKNDDQNSAISSAQVALRKFEDHNGSNAQVGKAHGILGRAYLHANDLGHAKDHLVRATQLFPQGGFQSDLSRVRVALTPRPQRVVRTVVTPKASTPKYPKRTAPVRRRARRSQPSAPSAAPAVAARPKRQAAPPPRRTAKKKKSGLRRAGGNNGLSTYYNTYKSSFSD